MFQEKNSLTKDLVIYNKSTKDMLLGLVHEFCGTITCDIVSYNPRSITYRIVSVYDVNYYTFLRDFFDNLNDLKQRA